MRYEFSYFDKALNKKVTEYFEAKTDAIAINLVKKKLEFKKYLHPFLGEAEEQASIFEMEG